MPEISVNPFSMKDAVLLLPTDDFAAACSSVAITPSSSTVKFQGLKPTASYTDSTPDEWTCVITFAQDWDTTGSLSRYLFDNIGETVEATFEPKSGGSAITANIIIAPGGFGGDAGAIAVSSVTFGVSGRPVLGAIPV